MTACLVLLASLTCFLTPPQDPVFSGPQPGERLSAFKVRGVYDRDAGKELDFVTTADGKPLVLLFVHDVNRLSISFTRVLMNYVHSRAKDGLAGGVVWLAEDLTSGEEALKRIQHAMPRTPVGISVDGKEGPGAYGLNRKVMLTVVVGKENKVTANFALIQPSLQADMPKVLTEIVRLVGGTVPKVDDLMKQEGMAPARPAANEPDPKLRELLRPVIRKDATEKEVDEAAAAVEKYAKENEAARKDIGRISKTIVDSGKLENYGTARAQEYLKKWAKEYGG